MSDACNWERVYSHSETGVPVTGSRSALVDAITDGADVKIVYGGSFEEGTASWWRTCTSVTIARLHDDPSRAIVSCVFTGIPDTRVTSAGRLFEEPAAVEWQAFNTTGQRQLVKFDPRTMEVLANETTNEALNWFVRR